MAEPTAQCQAMHMTFTLVNWGLPGRTKAVRWARVCIFVVALAPFLHACSPATPNRRSIDTLRIGAGGAAGAEAMDVLTENLFAEPLLYTDWHGRTIEQLAAGWRWEDEGTTLRVELRPGVKMHDGRSVTAGLVSGMLPAIMKAVLGFEYVTKVEASGDYTLLFRLSRPDTFLVDALASVPLTDGDIGTGPFKLRSRTPTIQADRNDNYYRGRPGLAHVQIVPYDRQRTAWAAMMRGDVDMLQEVARESVDFFEGASEIKTLSSIRPFYISLVFNLRHPILRRVDVRRALTEAIDREEIVAQAMRGRGMVADDPIWPYNWAYSAAARRHTYSPGTADMRLDTAGFPVKLGAADRMASRFRLSCVFWREGPQFERIALLLQRQLAAVGIDLELEPLSMRELRTRMKRGNFDTYLMMMTSGRTFRWTYRFWHSPPEREAEFQNTGYRGADMVLDRLRVARLETDVRAAVADLRQRFFEDVPAAFLAWPETTRAIDARFQLAKPDDPDIFANIWEWCPASTRRAAR